MVLGLSMIVLLQPIIHSLLFWYKPTCPITDFNCHDSWWHWQCPSKSWIDDPNCKMYLSKLQNEFIQNVSCICTDYQMYLNSTSMTLVYTTQWWVGDCLKRKSDWWQRLWSSGIRWCSRISRWLPAIIDDISCGQLLPLFSWLCLQLLTARHLGHFPTDTTGSIMMISFKIKWKVWGKDCRWCWISLNHEASKKSMA